MKLIERSYSTKRYRPKPLVHQEQDGSLIVILTPWGDPTMAASALDEVVKYVLAARSDVEVTSAFEFMHCISDDENHLRTALLLANETLYRSYNKKTYTVGAEVLVVSKKGRQVSWAQIGNPGILVNKANHRINLMSSGQDLSSEFSQGGATLPPLPSKLLGLEKDGIVSCGSFIISPEDRLILLSNDSVVQSLLSIQITGYDLTGLTQLISASSPEDPFWIGLVEMSG